MVPGGEGSPSVDKAGSGGIEAPRSRAWPSPAGSPHGSGSGQTVLDVVELAPTNELGDELGDEDGVNTRFPPDQA
jgi:hypothetical protein